MPSPFAGAGPKRHRITIWQPAQTTAGSFGETDQNPTQVCQCWASVEPLSGRELWLAAQVQADVTHRVRLRYRSGLTPKMYFTLGTGTRTFQIVSLVSLQERNRELELLCTEAV